MCERDEHERAAGEQGARVCGVEIAGGRVQQVTSRDLSDAVTKRDETLEAAHGDGDDIRRRRVGAQLAREQVQSQIVAAQHDQQTALAGFRQDHEVDRVGARRRAVELLDVALGGTGLVELDQTGMLKTQ